MSTVGEFPWNWICVHQIYVLKEKKEFIILCIHAEQAAHASHASLLLLSLIILDDRSQEKQYQFCFQRISKLPSALLQETVRFLGNKIH